MTMQSARTTPKKTERSIRVAWMVVAAALVAAAFLAWGAFRPAAPGLGPQVEATAVPSREDRVPEIVVVASDVGLRPNVIYAASGHPLRLIIRDGGDGPDRIVIADLGISVELPAGGETIVSLPVGGRRNVRVTDDAGTSLAVLRFQ
jgi:plastocyanin domain-containing protein